MPKKKVSKKPNDPITEYLNFIDQFIKEWYKCALIQKESIGVWSNFFNDYPFSFLNLLPYRFFPEPYIGNPTSKKFNAVFVNLNPGSGGDMQDVFCEHSMSILKLFKANNSSYQKTIQSFIKANEEFFKSEESFKKGEAFMSKLKRFKEDKVNIANLVSLHDTYCWWHDHRLLWLKKVLQLENTPSLNDIIGLELTPWHSTSYAEMGNTAQDENVWKYVLRPCVEFSKKIKKDSPLRKDKKAIVISKGSALKKLLTAENLKKLSKVDERLESNQTGIISLEDYEGWSKWTFTCPNTQWKCFFLVYSKGRSMRLDSGNNVKEMFERVLAEEI